MAPLLFSLISIHGELINRFDDIKVGEVDKKYSPLSVMIKDDCLGVSINIGNEQHQLFYCYMYAINGNATRKS